MGCQSKNCQIQTLQQTTQFQQEITQLSDVLGKKHYTGWSKDNFKGYKLVY